MTQPRAGWAALTPAERHAASWAREQRARETVKRNAEAPPGQRWCDHCTSYKPADAMAGHWCKDCRNADKRERWAALTPAERRASGHKSHGRPLTASEFAARTEAQASACAICGTVPPARVAGRPRADGTRAQTSGLVYDHDHATGAGRGLLCHRCNVMIGHAQDSTELLTAAIAYLAHWQTTNATTTTRPPAPKRSKPKQAPKQPQPPHPNPRLAHLTPRDTPRIDGAA